MLKEIINVLNRVIPKGNIVIFNSFPNVSGNALSVYECFVNRHQEWAKRYKIVWMINDNQLETAGKILKDITPAQNCIICKKKSAKGLWLYCRSRYIITTHNYITGVYTSGKQKHYNLWHGMPFKTIGRMIPGGSGTDQIQGDFTISSSEEFQKIMAQSFGLPKEQVLITGQPCNDLLFRRGNVLQKLAIKRENYKKIIMWMPTYRKSVVGAIRRDGNISGFGVVSVLNEHFQELNRTLEQNGYLLLVKLHPMDAINTMKLPESDHVKVICNCDLEDKQIILYELLGESDVLMTDYSSVFIDYLILNRPVAFVFSDMDNYSKSRGFSFENPVDYLPGEKIADFSQMINYLENMDVINKMWDAQRENVSRIFNLYFDNKSAERVCRAIFSNDKI